MDCARLRIVRAVYYAFHPGMHQSACAHCTRLNGYKKLAIPKAVVTQVRTGLAKSDDFSVGGGIGVCKIAIPAATDDRSRVNDDDAHGDFARFQCALCGAK